MVEEIAKKLAEAPKEAAKEGLDKVSETVKESSLAEQLDTIKNLSLDSLKAMNETSIKMLNEAKSKILENNRVMGILREDAVYDELKKQFPEKEGFNIFREQYLRNKLGEIVKDSVTGTGRRIDFLVTKGNEVVKSIEVTSKEAPKEIQLDKEKRILEQGGTFIKDPMTGELIKFPLNIKTEVWRRE